MTLTQEERWELCIKIMDCFKNNSEPEKPKLTSEQIVVWVSGSLGVSPLCVRKQIRLYLNTGIAIQMENQCPIMNVTGNALYSTIKETIHKKAVAQQNKR